MIEYIFTVDYEIYGNGEGSLKELVYDPAERLRAIFLEHGARFVVFPDVAELEMIEACGADPFIGSIKGQLKDFHKNGFELGLHIHPWWYKARREKGHWHLDFTEYNLCTQPLDRISQTVHRALAYIRKFVHVIAYTPTCFRAGHLLFQPAHPLSGVLAGQGIKMDSSVYRGGLWHQHNLDYRHAPKHDPYWKFTYDAARPELGGLLIEVPIYTHRAPIWSLLTSKRIRLQQTSLNARQAGEKILSRLSDFMRYRYPKKFDLGQMTKEEIVHMMDRIVLEDRRRPSAYRPLVVIMHTKDPIDYEAIDFILGELNHRRIAISTFSEVCGKIETLLKTEKNR